MKYLMDTHVWLWQLVEPERLSSKASKALDDRESELFLSPISVWEVLVLARKKRIRMDDPQGWVQETLRRTPASMAEITHEIAIRSENLGAYGGTDPADRFLAATCLVHDLALITSDRDLRGYRKLRTIW